MRKIISIADRHNRSFQKARMVYKKEPSHKNFTLFRAAYLKLEEVENAKI